MSRTATATTRTLALVLGLLLVALGAGTVAWSTGTLPAGGRVPSPADLADDLRTATSSPWWGWACGAVGAVALVLGITWLAAVLRPPRHEAAVLDGSDETGVLTADPAQAAAHLARLLSDDPDVRGSRSRVHDEHGRPVVTFVTKVDERCDLVALAARVDDLVGDLVLATDQGPLRVRHRLDVGARSRPGGTRVR